MKSNLQAIVGLAMCGLASSVVDAGTLLGTYEFTDNSLAITDADPGDGITFSDFELNSYTADEAFSAAADAVADPTLDEINLNGVESPNGTSSAFTAGEFLSFTVTNNSGATLFFEKLSGQFDLQNVFQQFQARVYTTTTPGDVVADTISKLGADFGGTLSINDDAFLDGTDADAGVNVAGVATSLADGDSVTFYLPYNMNSNSTARSMGIDTIQIFAVPEPGAASLGLLGAIAMSGARRLRK